MPVTTHTLSKSWIIGLAICCLASLQMPVAEAAKLVGGNTPIMTPAEVVQKLKGGGYVIYARHAKTEKVGEKEITEDDLAICDTQRNLSDEGRAQARAIGDAIKSLHIPIGKVLSSPYCRCLDTARLAYGEPEKSPVLYFAIHLKKIERLKVTRQLRALLAEPPAAGTNTVLVSHTANIKEAAGIWPDHEGDALVFKPDGKGNFSYIGKIGAGEWLQKK